MTYVAKHDSLTSLAILLEDVERTLVGCNRASLQEDLDTLSGRVRTRGLTVIMDDLPILGKLYDKGLSTGRFNFGEVPHSLKVSGRVLFSSILYRSFRKTTGQLIDPEPEVVFLTRAILYLYKKVRMNTNEKINHHAMEEFYSIDMHLPDPTLGWHGTFESHQLGYNYPDWESHPFASESDKALLTLFSRVSGYMFSQSSWIDWDEYRPKHGPGAVSDMPSGGDKYHFPSWPNRLSQVFPSNGWASHVHSSTEDSLPDTWGDDELTSKLICVPKTLSKPRVIASEPTAHMYCQQAIMNYLRNTMTNVARTCVDFNSQEVSRQLCLKASITGDHATVDLSAASDRLSLYVVERLLMPPDLREALRATRTRFVVSELREEPYLMRKFAPMGSAVTFPIQSLVYAAASITAILSCKYTEYDREIGLLRDVKPWYTDIMAAAREVQVFGDDIILPKHAVWRLEYLLSLLFLKVNQQKSHTDGFFRESCGMDAYRGVEVTPLYLAALSLGNSLSEIPSWVEMCNNAHHKGLWSLSNWMAAQIPQDKRKFIPVSSRNLGCVRLFTFSHHSLYPGKVRYNSELHRWEHRSICVQSRERREGRHDWYDLLQYFIEGSSVRYLAHLDPALTRVGHRTDYRTRVVVRWVAIE